MVECGCGLWPVGCGWLEVVGRRWLVEGGWFEVVGWR